MKRPAVLIVSVVAGALLVAGAGASAHTVQLLTRAAGTHAGLFSDEASGARTESPEPSESPEAAPTAGPTEKPEATNSPEAADTENEADDNDTETGDNEGDHQQSSGRDHESSGGGDD